MRNSFNNLETGAQRSVVERRGQLANSAAGREDKLFFGKAPFH